MTERNLNTIDIFQPFILEPKGSLKFMHGSLEGTCTQTYTHIHLKTITLKTRQSTDLVLPLDMCSQIPLISEERICNYFSVEIHQLSQ